jgi:TonB family protein
MLWLFLAQLAAPVAIKPTKWLTPNDVPVESLPMNAQTRFEVAITVDPSGKTENCRVEQSSARQELNERMCHLIKRRARFDPATDAKGQPTYGVYRTYFEFWVGEGHPPPTDDVPDLTIMVAKLPASVKGPVKVPIAIAVDANGLLSSCGPKDHNAATLGKIACEQFLQKVKLLPATNAEGTPVFSIQNADVRFVEGY